MPSSATAPLAVSFGKVDITPSTSTALGGYGVDRPRMSTGTRLPLWARCLVLWDNGAPNVLVTLDVLGLGRTLHQNIRSRVINLRALANTSNFVITAIHTHNGPVLPEKLDPFISYNMTGDQLTPVQAYANQLADKVVGLVKSTLAGQRLPCTLDHQVKTATFAVNRETAKSYVETDVPILVARDAQTSAPRAVLFGYGCHPVAAGRQNRFDPDFPGAAIKLIEANGGPFAQFLTGPAGDQNPATVPGPDAADDYGRTLAGLVSDALRTAGRPVWAPIRTGYQEITLPLDISDIPTNLAVVRSLYEKRASHPEQIGFNIRHAQTMIRQIDANSFATSVPLPQQVWRLAGVPDLRIAFTGGEPVAGYGAYFRTQFGGSNGVWFNGYANEVPCYLPSDGLCQAQGINYACGFYAEDPGIAGGAMTVYACVGHLRYRAAGDTTTNGVEQVMITSLTSLLNAT